MSKLDLHNVKNIVKKFGSLRGQVTKGDPSGTAARGNVLIRRVCFSRQDLSTHNSTTHKQDPRPYRCDQCGRQFSTCAYLSQHRRIHSGIKPYVCRYCDRKFTQLSHVQQHERIHTGEKPYKCATCFKSFTQMSNLQSHQRQHMKGKPHRCENCFMSYDTKEELDVHVQAKHSGNRYAKVLVCPACSKSYNSETYLAKHMERHKEAVTNANVSRFGALNTSAGALGALSGFMTSHHTGMGGRSMAPVTEHSLHEELQQRIGHPQDLQNLQRAAVAAAASIMSPMGPGSVSGLTGHDTNHLLHHLPTGLQGQLAVAQKGHQQTLHGGGTHPGGHSTPSGFPDTYQQHQMLAATSPYSNQMPSFLGRTSTDRQMPRFPPTPLDAGRKMMDFQAPPPPPPPMAHQQIALEHTVPPQPPSMQPPLPPQFQPPPPLPQQQQQQMRPFGHSPQAIGSGKSRDGGKTIGEDGKDVNSNAWEQGPVTPIPMDGQEDGAGGVSITGDEPGAPNLWTPHSAAKRLKPDPDERVGGYNHHHQHHHHQPQQPFETEYLRRSATAEAQYQQHMVPPQMPPTENSMEHVVDKLAKFWQRNSVSQGIDGKPGRDIRIEALLSGFPPNPVRERQEEGTDEEVVERLRHIPQSSSTTNRERDFRADTQSPRASQAVQEDSESAYCRSSANGGGEDREGDISRNGTTPPNYRVTYANAGNPTANDGGGNAENNYSAAANAFYGADAAARDLSVMRDDERTQQPTSAANEIGFAVHFSSQSQ
uniref:C2H2-type domain-containing protein n=1 Tax=Echinococcus canadensis TaxID=519352 RepID=A0A915F0L2_9CEST